jgi:ribose transport system substrate-binding protein
LDIVRFDVGEAQTWLGWANMDLAMRLMLGLTPPKTEHTALRIFTKSNIAQAGNPPVVTKGYGSAYVAGYTKLWSGKSATWSNSS